MHITTQLRDKDEARDKDNYDIKPADQSMGQEVVPTELLDVGLKPHPESEDETPQDSETRSMDQEPACAVLQAEPIETGNDNAMGLMPTHDGLGKEALAADAQDECPTLELNEERSFIGEKASTDPASIKLQASTRIGGTRGLATRG